jgi:hypothetical protein
MSRWKDSQRCFKASRRGLCIGKARLADGTIVLAVLGEPFLCDGRKEITDFGGWRAYIASSKFEGRHKK